MLYAVISDIHANLEALKVCLDELDKVKPDRVICLGDLVDYCAQPNEIIEIIKDKCDAVIIGNHDEAQFNYALADGFTQNAYISSLHTRTVIKNEYIEYLQTLPYTYSENNVLFVHGSPYMPETYKYVLNLVSAETNFKSFSESVCFIGHSHKPVIFEKAGEDIRFAVEGILNPASRYIINVGSVGQPRDHNPMLSFGLFDTEKYEYKNVRLEYDIRTAADKILNEGLPIPLAERLYKGI